MRALLLLLLIFPACTTSTSTAPVAKASPSLAGEDFWNALRPHCGRAYEGRLVEGNGPADAAVGAQRLVMHVRACSDEEIRIPFFVGEDRSRTWVITRTASGVRLKHDHRHQDGTPDRLTMYGGDTKGAATGRELAFHADAHTAELLPVSATNVWTMIAGENTFTYWLRRTDRTFRVDFDLTKPVATPPDPW